MGAMEYFPVELWARIMCFLPVKSLLVFRTICKLFLSIIDDPNFISSHLRTLPNNLHENLTLVHTHSFGRYEIRDRNGGLTLPAILDPGLEPVNCRILTASLDGLVLLTPTDGPLVGFLWNPSTGKIRKIQLPTPESESESNPRSCPSLSKPIIGVRVSGLAYDSTCRDYKLLYITYDYLSESRRLELSVPPLGVWVYRVKTQSWTTVNMVNSGISTLRAKACGHPCSLFFEGGLLWIEAWYSDDKEYRLRMVRFDVGTHTFQYNTNLPLLAEKHKRMEGRLVTLDGGSTLGLCGLDVHDLVSIWSWAEDVGSWVGRCVIPEYPVQSLDFGTFLGVSKDGELKWKYRTSDRTRTLKMFSYNLRTCHQSEINPSRCMFYEGGHCAYIQSLIEL